ncbi:MAG TPA: cytochrome c biogenesis protein CcsA, partial [Fimbriimonadaceae bacterium]|nr:cytochrome c biogenesis protein CcsA [Fimbriimonadaceae bacterium]
LACILAYESPFGMWMMNGKPFIPDAGEGLTPALQNYWVTIHPPTIFMGFGALTVLAAYAMSAMLTNKPLEWVKMVRPWALLAMTLTGVGLCMGGFWAYETLGWGGFWAWDPVENVSFVPWITSAAFVHGIMVQITKKHWIPTNLLLGGGPFLLFVYGTFLTRSGVLNDTSVHSFANMDHSALWLLLGFMFLSILAFLGVWFWRLPAYRKLNAVDAKPVQGLHREGLYRLGAWLMAGLGAGAAIGMSWPMFMALAGQKPKVVEASLYHHTLSWLYIPLMIAMGIGPLVAWRGMGAKEFLNRLFGVICVSVLVVGFTMMVAGWSPWIRSLDPSARVPFFHFGGIDIRVGPKRVPFIHFGGIDIGVGLKWWVLFLCGLSVFVAVANIWRITELIKRSTMSAAAFLAHVGVATLMAGLIISEGFEQKTDLQVSEGQHAVGLGYFVSYKGMTSDTTDRDNKVLFDVDNGHDRFTASPGLYYIEGQDGQQQAMVWPHIQTHPFYDIYMALQPPTQNIGVEQQLQPGQSMSVEGLTITYEKMTRQGTPGQPGAKWGALLKVSNGMQSIEVNPKIVVGGGDEPAQIDDNRQIEMTAMRAGANAVSLQLESLKPIYTITMFFKPMTILVWGGTGIMAFAGLLSAFYRRVRPVTAAAPVETKAQKGSVKPKASKKPVPVMANRR